MMADRFRSSPDMPRSVSREDRLGLIALVSNIVLIGVVIALRYLF